MKVWIITIYEPLPLLNPNVRPMRWGMMIEALTNAGHQVELWTSSFDHIRHEHLKNASDHESVTNNISVQFIHGCGYQSDISPKRWLHFRQMAKEFRNIAETRVGRPDIIITQIPALELAEAVVDFGKNKTIPVIVDIRDPWPDVYLRPIPVLLRKWFRWILFLEIMRLRRIILKSTAITAVSYTYLKWAHENSKGKDPVNDRVYYLGHPGFDQFSESITAKTRELFLQKYHIGKDDILILYSGTFCGSSDYDWESVLRVAKRLIEESHLSIKIMIAGKGEIEKELIKKSRSLPNIIFPGWLDYKELSTALACADIGLLPFAKTALMSMPNKPFEYMAAGIPVVNSLKGELWALVENNQIGKCYNSGDAEQLYNIICWFVDHRKETVEMGSKAKALFEKHFSSKIIYPDFVKFMESISGC